MKGEHLSVGLSSMAYLADHAVQDSVLLPGSFYVATGLRLQREFFDAGPGRVRDAVFHSPVVLSAEDVRLEVEARQREDGVTDFGARGQLVRLGHTSWSLS